ncbi:diguanylate cyclase [Butyrivibrio sp. XB500-5]|uniref:GGDEF domain-containing protein n=1 Tax=Butyrivibrio sp. XB500-5 TaxID=2364880 RepID=UPI000EAA0FAD|nr:diguanylate cyclase [Butyrivibrio sp. XB500-5]RKM61657.1 diguanylate cyclase [Butyrivibrio sp. XB500-5]
MKFRKNTRFVAILLLAIFFLLIMALLKVIDNSYSYSSSLTTLEDRWTVSLNDDVLKTSSVLHEVNIPVINEGDSLVLTRTIPYISGNSCCLYFFTKHATVDVYVGKDLIYSYGRDIYEKYRECPDRFNCVSLTGSHSGNRLKVVLTGTRRASFSSLSEFVLGSRVDILSYHLLQNSVSIFSGIFLSVLGLILIIISPYMYIYHDRELRLFFSGLTSFLLGLFILGQYGLIDMLINNPHANSVAEYASFVCIPISITGYLFSVFPKRSRPLFQLMFLYNIAFFIVLFILNNHNIIKFSDVTTYIQGSIIIQSIIAIILMYREREHFFTSDDHNTTSDLFFILGLLAFMIFAISDIFVYDYHKYKSNSGNIFLYGSGFTFGALLFVSCLIISYLFYSIYNNNYASMKRQMVDLAYTDPLTGLANRARCEQIMQVISNEHSLYTIFSIDLNKLKVVNDTYGHHEGDRLLMGFSTILTNCFWDANLIGRMGGDEFIVILLDEQASHCTKRIHEFYALLSEWNRKEQVFQYSASYGYAYSYEVPNSSAQEVYMLADSRMYEMKKEHQQNKEMGVPFHA